MKASYSRRRLKESNAARFLVRMDATTALASEARTEGKSLKIALQKMNESCLPNSWRDLREASLF